MAESIDPWAGGQTEKPSGFGIGGGNQTSIDPWATTEDSVSVGGAIKAIPAAALRLGVGLASWIPEGLVNAADLAISGIQGKVPTFETGKKVAETIQNILPTETPNVAAVETPFMYPFKKLAEWQTQAGEAVYGKTQNPALAATAETAIGAIPFIALPFLGRGSRMLKERIAAKKAGIPEIPPPVETGQPPIAPKPLTPVEESLKTNTLEKQRQAVEDEVTKDNPELKAAIEIPVRTKPPIAEPVTDTSVFTRMPDEQLQKMADQG